MHIHVYSLLVNILKKTQNENYRFDFLVSAQAIYLEGGNKS